MIDATAQIAAGASIGRDVQIGPLCIIGPQAEIGDGCRLVANVVVTGCTAIGAGNVVHPFAVLGGAPQATSYRGEPTRLVIGEGNTIRECVTINAGTADGGGVTRVGSGGYFMAYSHIAHDCRVGDHVQMANGATLGGHSEVGDHVFLSSHAAVHQYSRIGGGALIAASAVVRGDVIPFAMVSGVQARLAGINVVGMRRRKYPAASINAARAAFRALFLGDGPFSRCVETVERELGADPAVAEIVAFLRGPHRRAICHARHAAAVDAD
jgi:UDP-N-acetylglucosamine acyltransferase